MNSLMELSARTLLWADVAQDLEEEAKCQEWDIPYRPLTRCACDFSQTDFKSGLATSDFIARLPLPEKVKEFMRDVALDLCQEHLFLAFEDGEDDYDDEEEDGEEDDKEPGESQPLSFRSMIAYDYLKKDVNSN